MRPLVMTICLVAVVTLAVVAGASAGYKGGGYSGDLSQGQGHGEHPITFKVKEKQGKVTKLAFTVHLGCDNGDHGHLDAQGLEAKINNEGKFKAFGQDASSTVTVSGRLKKGTAKGKLDALFMPDPDTVCDSGTVKWKAER